MLPAGQVIISKVFVGQSVPVLVGFPVSQNHYPKAYSVYQNVETQLGRSEGMLLPHPKTHQSNYVRYLSNVIIPVPVFPPEGTGSSKTHSVPECSPGQRRWFVFDHELVLPEYIVFFEYVFGVMKRSIPPL